jgi:hypothetical protein
VVLRWDVLRIVSLVAAGVASGYLWRAALEEPRLETVFPLGSTAQPLPDWLQPQLQPPTFERVRVGPRRVTRQRLRPPAPRARSAPASRTSVGRSGSALAAATLTDNAASTPRPPRTRSPQRPRRIKPPKTERPSPPRSPSKPPAPRPPPAPPPAPPPPAAPTKPLPPPPPADGPTGSRPGWGKGDKNHNHTGPPGRGKR